MFCKNCGNKLTENDRFCKKCGTANDKFIEKEDLKAEESFSNHKEEVAENISDEEIIEDKIQEVNIKEEIDDENNGIIKEGKNLQSNISEDILDKEENNNINGFEETLKLNADEINKESKFHENINNKYEEVNNELENNNSLNEDLIPNKSKKSKKKIIIVIVSFILIGIISFLSIYFVQKKGYMAELEEYENKTANLVLDEEETKEINRLLIKAEDFNGLYTKDKKNEELKPIKEKIEDFEKSSLEKCEKLIEEINIIEISDESKLSLKLKDKLDEAKNNIAKGKYIDAYESLVDLKENVHALEKLSKENKLNEEAIELEKNEVNNTSANNTIDDAVADYLNGMVSALNTGDYAYVSAFIVPGSPANTAQANYIKKYINEELLSHSIISEKDIDSSTKDIVVIEEYNIINASDGYHYRKNQGTYRFKIDSDNNWKLHSFPAKVKVLEKR